MCKPCQICKDKGGKYLVICQNPKPSEFSPITKQKVLVRVSTCEIKHTSKFEDVELQG